MLRYLLIILLVATISSCKKDTSSQNDSPSLGNITLNNNGRVFKLELNYSDKFYRNGTTTDIWFYPANSDIALSFKATSQTAPSYVGQYDISGRDCFVIEKFQGGIEFRGNSYSNKIGEMIVTESTDTYKKGTFSFTAQSASNSGNQTRTFTGSFTVYQ